MDENKLLESIFERITLSENVVVGPGGDCAAIEIAEDRPLLLMAVDQLISNIHFDPKKTSKMEIGAKLLKRNISDIAAMGGYPANILMTLASNRLGDIESITEIFDGVIEEAKKWDISLCGGDLASLPQSMGENGRDDFEFLGTITITGYVEREKLSLRKNGKVGEDIFITGEFGASYIAKHHIDFIPRVDEARFIAGKYTNTMIDVSDGLLIDLYRIAIGSSVSMEIDIDKIPPRISGLNEEAILTDGEDYELIFTVNSAKSDRLLEEWPFKDVKITKIGKIIENNGEKGSQIFDKRGRDLVRLYYNNFYDHIKK